MQLDHRLDDGGLGLQDVTITVHKTTTGKKLANGQAFAENGQLATGVPLTNDFQAQTLWHYLTCALSVFIFYLAYGYLQELIFQLDGFKPYGLYLTLIQFVWYSTFAYLERAIRQDNVRRIPFVTYILLAFLTVCTMGFSNASVGYLNYPTQVVFKCCKLIPVLVGGILIQGKSYTAVDFVAAGCMSTGLAFFVLTDTEVSPAFDPTGVFLISSALVADAVIGNVQEKEIKKNSATNIEVVFYSYSMGIIYILTASIAVGQLIPAFRFCAQHPKETYGYAFFFSLAGYCGVKAVLTLVTTAGAFVAVTVTTFRKSVTIVLSFILFAKPFSYRYLWSGMLVVAGIYLSVYSKQLDKAEFQTFPRQVVSWLRKRMENLSVLDKSATGKTVPV